MTESLATELPEAAVLELLTTGELELEGRLVLASNASFVGTVSRDAVSMTCVYKPIRGERPLWDFPDGTLASREVAAYELSAASGWNVVPPTVLRDGPLGTGMCQQWIEPDPDRELIDLVLASDVQPGWLPVLEAQDERGRPVVLVHASDPALMRMALFDAVVNNADRKGGHVLPTQDGQVLGVDHGVTFHTDDKLRTVLWGWAGEPIPPELIADLRNLLGQLGEGQLARTLQLRLAASERRALVDRTRRLLRRQRFPVPSSQWPAIPWPAF